MPPALDSRVVLVTGTKRVGAAVAVAAAGQGANVALLYQNSKAEADAAASDVRAAGRLALVVQADVSKADDARRVVSEVEGTLGRLDVLINMASVYRRVAFDALDEREWRRQLAVDFDGTFFFSRAAVPALRRQGRGHIINISDWLPASGRPRYPGYLGYYVAKAGVKALTEALALELAPDRIQVNAIAPGPILPPPDISAEEVEAVVKATPLGKWGGPEAIVDAVFAILSSDFMTGETIRVDGGRHLA